ncbi:MAG: glycolate oxidase subunit GlcD [ANME-2 cluster archaeon HR1]|jgi:glycolate oxidase subunit GlcD|nr:MAG: glycolate oxidase subunit GlcD [ANME-2 cluster archaeon HR1]
MIYTRKSDRREDFVLNISSGGLSVDIFDEIRDIVTLNRVSRDPAELYCYSYDASYISSTPDYVVMPHSTQEVSAIVKLASQYRIPIVPRGAGTGLSGGAVPISGGIVLDMSRMNKLQKIDIPNLQVLVEPGLIHARLNSALEPYGFFFPPDPGSSEMCTLGGFIANGGSGMRSVKYGTVTRYVLDLEIVLPDGEIIQTGSMTMKSASGYDLNALMVGSEGTLGIITAARLKIHPIPKARKVVLAHFNDLDAAGRAVPAIMGQGIVPSACELMDSTTIQALNIYDPDLNIPECEALLLIEVDGTPCSIDSDAVDITNCCRALGAFDINTAGSVLEQQEIWKARRLVGAVMTRLYPDKTRVYIGEDIAVPLSAIPAMLKDIRSISSRYNITIMTYGHAGDGNLHTGMAIDILDKYQYEQLKQVADDIHRAALRNGGTVSGEHGIGCVREIYMEQEHGRGLDVMKQIKKALDPHNIMNPQKVGLE